MNLYLLLNLDSLMTVKPINCWKNAFNYVKIILKKEARTCCFVEIFRYRSFIRRNDIPYVLRKIVK